MPTWLPGRHFLFQEVGGRCEVRADMVYGHGARVNFKSGLIVTTFTEQDVADDLRREAKA